MVDRHLAVPPGPVHRVDVGIDEDLVEVPDDDGQRGQDRFVEVNGGGNIDPPARQQIAHPDLGPHHDAGEAHERGAPDERPVLGLLAVGEAAEFGLLGSGRGSSAWL